MSKTTTTLTLALLALPGCLAPQADVYPDAVHATPQRPTFSQNTNTTAAGTFEIEAGLMVDPTDTHDVPITLKYGLGDTGELFVSRDVYKRVFQSGTSDRGTGDTTVGTRWRLWEGDADPQTGDRSSFAVQVGLRVPTGSKTKGGATNPGDQDLPMSEDEYASFLAAIMDGTMGEWDWTAFYQVGSIGIPDDGSRSTQHAAAVVASHPLGGDVSAFGEIAGWYDRARSENPLFATYGLTFAEQPGRVWDISLRHGLNDDAPDFLVQAGLTVNMGGPGDG